MTTDPASLESLHDIVGRGPVPFWPPAQGWWWLIAFLAVGGVIALSGAISWWQRKRYRREALAEWRRYDALLANETSRMDGFTGLATVMKRVALSVSPRAEVASLTGAAWLDFLDRTGGAKDAGEWLEQVSYDPRKAESLDERKTREISAQVEAWIRCSGSFQPAKDEDGRC